MPRVAAKERRLYAEKVIGHLRRYAAGDPESVAHGLSLEGVRKGAGVSRTPLSTEADTCSVVRLLLDLIGKARRGEPLDLDGIDLDSLDVDADDPLVPVEESATATVQAQATEPFTASDASQAASVPRRARTAAQGAPGLDLLSDKALNSRIREYKRQVQKAMEGWIARHGSGASVNDAPLAAHDLELTLWTLRKVADELGPVLDLLDQRERAAAHPTPPAGIVHGGQGTLDI